jgi:hypothetical protein
MIFLCALSALCSEKAPPNRAFSLVWVLQTNMRDCGENVFAFRCFFVSLPLCPLRLCGENVLDFAFLFVFAFLLVLS